MEKYWAKVLQQRDGSSCGLYIVAFAVDFANGVNSEEVRYDEIAMRNYFAKWLAKDSIRPFSRSQ